MAKSGSSGDFTLDKGLPSNLEAERAILGAILLDNGLINQAAERLRRDDFFLDSHRRIYEKMLVLYEAGRGIEPISLQEELRRAGDLDLVGGPAYITSLFDGVARFANLDNYTKIVKDKSVLRRLITTSNQIMATCFDGEQEADEILDNAERLILSIGEERIRQGFVPISEVAKKQLEYIEEIAGRDQLITGIATGFNDLDYMTAGLQRGDLVIIAARPSMGKCLAADSEIVLADGSVRTIEEIYHRQEATLLTLWNDYGFRFTNPSAFIDDGIKPVYRVTTRLGRQVDSTITHPYLTVDGWRPLGKLKVGDAIAVPRQLRIFGAASPSCRQIHQLIASLDTDGSDEACVPAVVFRLAKHHMALFIERLFAAKGWIDSNPGSQPTIGLASASKRLARQVQHLLLRFGIISQMHKRAISEGGGVRGDWQIEISNSEAVQAFLIEIGSLNLRMKSESCIAALDAKAEYLAPAGKQIIKSDVYWDEIVSIEYLGEKQVYDLTIPETHNFVANDICVHNTAFCLNIAQNASTRPQYHGRKAVVGIFSLEMSKEQLVNRLLCSQARIDAHRLRSGMLNKEDWKKLAYAVSELAEAKIYLDDTPGITTLEMRAKARRLRNEQKALDMLIVDYLQLMSGRGRNESRQQEVSQISRELKLLAKELDVPLIALSQLSRAPEARTGNRPQLSDLRESGSLEQDADVVMFIYREDVYKPDTEKQNIAEIIIGKQRNGPTGSVELVFLKQLTRFEDRYRE